MADNKKVNKNNSKNNPLIGAITEPTTLDTTTKIDIDTNKNLIDDIIEFSLSNGLDVSKLDRFTSISNSRSQVYTLIDTMANDASVAAILKTYTEEVCEVSDSGHIVWCESSNPAISKFVNYLLNVMNVDKNIYSWVYCLLKYGDVYLKLYRESDYKDDLFNKDNVDAVQGTKIPLREDITAEDIEKINESVRISMHNDYDRYSYYAEMVADPSTMFELTKFGKTYGYIETPNEEGFNDYLTSYIGIDNNAGQNQVFTNYRMKSSDVNVYQADDFVHACLDDGFTRFPEKVDIFMNDSDYASKVNAQKYTVKKGKSLLIDTYKIWREKTLLENAILLNRLTRSSVLRNVQVEVGDMPKTQAQGVLRRIKELFEQRSAYDAGNGMIEYANPGPVENNIFTTTHNGQGAITVSAVGGDIEVKNLGDLDEWVNKFYAAFGIPKQYYGYCEDSTGFNGGTSLAIISSVFAKSVKRTQNSILQMLTDAINLFLLNRGCKTYINNFVLKMKAPLTQEEKDYREDLTNRISAISNMQSLFADVEDKGRKLRILKLLLSTLNYNDDLLEEIQGEIDDADNAKNTENETTTADSVENTSDESSMELVNSGDVSLESLGSKKGMQLNEDQALDDMLITENTDLPTPEELNKKIDFTINN